MAFADAERYARAICASTGVDPDLESIVSMNPVKTQPAWTRYIAAGHAIVAIVDEHIDSNIPCSYCSYCGE